MKKFDIAFVETRRMVIAIEANDQKEAEQLFCNKLRNDDYFCDDIYERLENGVENEEVHVYELGDDEIVDFTYEEMTEEVE